MKRLAVVLSLLAIAIVLAVPAFARVISYAPYTDRIAAIGYHERDSRYFALIERESSGFFSLLGQVVVYDSSGEEEPRVVYPANGQQSSNVAFVALYEPKIHPGSPDVEVKPWILISTGSAILVTSNGGATWSTVPLPPQIYSIYSTNPTEVDFGGPFVNGLGAQILPGNDSAPFVLVSGQYIYVVGDDGQIRILAQPTPGNPFPYMSALIGRDLAGNQILAQHEGTIVKIDLNTGTRTALMQADLWAQYTGWITPDGYSYLQMLRPEGRFLFLNHDGQTTFVLGPYNAGPPSPTTPGAYSPDSMRFFAVPTSDFHGAWMIQRETGKPTTLLRHVPGFATETMWSDVTGPNVEALIAGASGETLLVQVHRERQVALDRPFVDPALAVWHVGLPEPRSYDELYLNETWNKGFVHVDVDSIESGTPFVFYSGSTEVPDIIVSPAPPGGGDVIQEWGVVRASLKQRLVLPGVARLPGAFNSFWLTDVTISNPLNEPQEVEIRFVSLGQAVQAAEAPSITLTLNPNEIRFIPDALKALFGTESGGGALHILPAYGVSAVGRTYSRRPDGGTFGFGMLAIDFFNAAGPRFPLTFSGAFPGEHFRTNILVTDTSGRGSAADVNALGINGTLGASTFHIAAPVNGITQFNGLGNPLGLVSDDAGGLIVKPTRGTLIPTVVAIDNRTNDPTYFPPDIPATVPRVIPVIGHLDGANNSHFRSDLFLLNPTNELRTVILEAKQWDTAQRKNVQFTLLPREARVIPDVLATMFGMIGVARLEYQSREPGQGVRVTSRTYTVEESGATYGCLIAPLNNFQIAAGGDRLEILGVNAGANFRVNIGLVELTRNNNFGSTSVRIWIVDQASQLVDTFTVNVQNGGGMQINDIFAARGKTPPIAARILVDVLGGNPGGLIGAYVTLTDNITNDSTYLAAQLGAQPD